MATKQAARAKTSRTNGAKTKVSNAASARADAAFIPDHRSEWESSGLSPKFCKKFLARFGRMY